jgi:nucleotide-binding universal stress UspA family protein
MVAYDGSASSESALDDLVRAGLPASGHALIITVAEMWLPRPNAPVDNPEEVAIVAGVARQRPQKSEQRLVEADTLARHAERRFRSIMPGWQIRSCTTFGSPSREILTAANSFDPDLIVVGFQGNSLLGRLILGSVSQKLLTEAACSVRIARGPMEVDPGPSRLVIGFDASQGSLRAVDEVANRVWPTGSEVVLAAATDSVRSASIAKFILPPVVPAEAGPRSEDKWIAALAEKAMVSLSHTGMHLTIGVSEGNPNHVLIREAEHWNADCIFLGANSTGSRTERFMLGSTAASIAAHARCSVEIVRHR